MRHLLPLGFPGLDADASDIQLLLGPAGLRQVAAKLFPQVVPGLRSPLPGESDLQEVSQVLLGVDQEGVGGIQLDLLHSARGEGSWSQSPRHLENCSTVGVDAVAAPAPLGWERNAQEVPPTFSTSHQQDRDENSAVLHTGREIMLPTAPQTIPEHLPIHATSWGDKTRKEQKLESAKKSHPHSTVPPPLSPQASISLGTLSPSCLSLSRGTWGSLSHPMCVHECVRTSLLLLLEPQP